jgi:hypothetical protein
MKKGQFLFYEKISHKMNINKFLRCNFLVHEADEIREGGNLYFPRGKIHKVKQRIGNEQRKEE